MFATYRQPQQRSAIFSIFALSIPCEEVNEQLLLQEELNSSKSSKPSSTKSTTAQSPVSWTVQLMRMIVNDLDIEEEQVHAYIPLLLLKNSSSRRLTMEERKEFASPILRTLNFTYSEKLSLFVRILFRLAMMRFYDGRGRTFLRNLAELLGIQRDDFIFIEETVARYFYTNIDKIEKMIKNESKDDGNAKLIRYAKIGAVSIGAGAVLALTGGLAAPALAAAFVTMGSASAAAAVSVTTMATIFGSAGAGLAGYKMMRRTRGLQEFEFETHGESNKFALLIAVSGWLEEPEDYKRAFGVLPAHLPDRERLVRFYELHAPQRLLKVDMEVQEFADHFDDLYHQLAELYGKDPRDNEQLLPRAELDVFPGTAEAVGGFLAEIDESARSSSLLSAFTSSSSRRDRNKKTGADSLSCLTSLRSRGALGDEDGGESAASYWNWAELRESAAYELCLLRWETQLQREMGDSIKELVKSLGSSAVQNILAATVLTAVASAVLWPVFLIQLTSVIDNSWVLAIETADAAGKELAQAILNRSNGTRPITLVGYSFGARVVYSCLRELALQTGELSAADFDLDEDNFRRAAPESAQEPRDDDDEDEPALPQQQQPVQQSAQPSERSFFGFSSSRSAASAGEKDEKAANRLTALEVKAVIQDVVLLGAPVSANSRAWPAIRNLVAGRIVNGYSQRDLVLGLIYRYQRFHLSVCGVTPIEGVAGVENLDLSELIERHTDYGRRMHQILETVGLSSAREISPVPPT